MVPDGIGDDLVLSSKRWMLPIDRWESVTTLDLFSCIFGKMTTFLRPVEIFGKLFKCYAQKNHIEWAYMDVFREVESMKYLAQNNSVEGFITYTQTMEMRLSRAWERLES